MKTSLVTVCTLLTVVSGGGGMIHDEVKETGTEGSAAVIHCPYTKGYETYIKYFCKGVYKNCTTLLQTNGEDSWRREGRLSLNDKKIQRLIVVTIKDLRIEDTGPYGCGIERIGQDPFTLVHLTVNKAPRPPQRPQTTTVSTTVSSTVSTHTTPGNSTAAVTNTTGNSSKLTDPQPSASSGSLPTAGGALCGVLLVLIVISGLYCALRSRASKDTRALVSGRSNSVRNTEDVPLYEEIQATDVNNSITTHQCPAEHSRNTSTTDQRHNSHPTITTVYSTVTDVDLDNTLGASHTHPSTDLQSQGPEHQYSEMYFINNPDINPALKNEDTYSSGKQVIYNPIYLL
ncbi:CMRF35-like molecule 6 [Hoplias malabaricus]|uniref:CMRF35-like molecule 6 n=1 Tax=Hoplias malabaricus TaxID=27720 RepID=UPI0034633573